jgi:cobalt-zinc-cadmium efflux system membrane fusion protein
MHPYHAHSRTNSEEKIQSFYTGPSELPPYTASVKITFALALTLAAATACSRTEDAPLSGEERRGPAASVSTPAQAMPLVVVPPDSPRFKQLRIEPVREQAFPADEVVAPARVMINPNRISRVLPPVQGRVLAVFVKLGDAVEEGQPLATLNSPDADAAISAYVQADATLRQAKVTLTKTEMDLERSRKLLQFQAISEKDVLAAQNDDATARAALENAEAARAQTLRKLTLLGLTPTDLQQPYVVRAPIAGVVTDISVTPGDYRAAVSSAADVTTPLMSIADLSTVWVASDVPEPFIRLIHVGEHVDITFVAYPGERFNGRVARVGTALDPQTRTLKVQVDLPNPARRFLPEMFGTMRHAGPPQRFAVVPPAAIVQEYGRSQVFVERAPGQFERRVVTTGVRTTELVAITSGLDGNSRVIVDGAILLRGQ